VWTERSIMPAGPIDVCPRCRHLTPVAIHPLAGAAAKEIVRVARGEDPGPFPEIYKGNPKARVLFAALRITVAINRAVADTKTGAQTIEPPASDMPVEPSPYSDEVRTVTNPLRLAVRTERPDVNFYLAPLKGLEGWRRVASVSLDALHTDPDNALFDDLLQAFTLWRNRETERAHNAPPGSAKTRSLPAVDETKAES
jgi:hypothetical protein